MTDRGMTDLETTTPALSYRQLLRIPSMRALLLATTLARLGGRMLSLAIVLYALARTDSPALAGWLSFALLAPGLAISPIAGALIDRAGAVWAITADMAASTACLLALALTDSLGAATPPMLLTLTALFSLTSPLSAAGIRTLLPRLTPRETLDRANALDTSVHGLTDIAGPALAGLLISTVGAAPTFCLIALVYAGATLAIATIRHAHPAPPARRHLLAEALAGLLRVLRQPTLRGLAVCYGLYQITWGALIVLVPVVAARHFGPGAGASMAGLLWAGSGAVGVAGALVIGQVRALGRERQVMALGMLLTAAATFPLATLGTTSLALALMLCALAAGPVDVALLTLRQRRTDPAELGRVLSVSMSLNLAGVPLGAALAGTLVPWSLPATFAAAALASLLAATAVALVPPQHPTTRA
jgi:predicted MFS family arabinose efflux permease